MGCCCKCKAMLELPDHVKDCLFINEAIGEAGIFGHPKKEIHKGQNASWRISPEPFWISPEVLAFFETLGNHLLAFYRATNKLYFESVRGRRPSWVREYLDLGKPESVIDYGRMNRFRHDLPVIIRPDILLTDEGAIATELDSVPGGFGILAALSRCYERLGFRLAGGPDGVVRGFARAIRGLVPDIEEPVLAIVVSRESEDYWNEMAWIGGALNEAGLEAYTVRPEEITFREDGLFLVRDGETLKIDVIYRFFELFDLKNIPKMDLILYAVRKQLAVITPPLKSYLEEKLLFALFHHPVLSDFWRRELGDESYSILKGIFPETWIMDPRPLPPHAVIPGLEIGGVPVTDFRMLGESTKRERELVIKPSGFSELAWGSHGVKVGHDLSLEEWKEAIEVGLQSFHLSPYILQRFYKPQRVSADFYDFEANRSLTMAGRARLCPYYFVTGDEARLGGVLVTICPLDKKLIHGMVDAIMVPAAGRPAKPCLVTRT